MTAENKQTFTDGNVHGESVHAQDRSSEQARFMDKLRQAAKSTTSAIGRTTQCGEPSASSQATSSAAVQDILSGFTLEDGNKISKSRS